MKNTMKKLRLIASVLLFSCLLAGVSFAQESARQTPVVKVVRRWGPSVVNISTERVVEIRANPFFGFYGDLMDEFYGQFPDMPVGTMKLKSLGSGVIVSADGVIVTNAHVVNMASDIYVILSDGTQTKATLIAVAKNDDLALIKITLPRELKPVRPAADVMTGETVIAIGDPFGLENSVSVGVVSGVNRKFYFNRGQAAAFEGLIQTDASINMGSSGGALLNLDGELAGINLAVVQNAQNIGFAIPYDKIKWLLGEYEKEKMRQRQAQEGG